MSGVRFFKLKIKASQLIGGINVQNRQLNHWLTEDEYEQIDVEWQHQKDIRDELREKPRELKRYEKKLHEATFNDNKAERFRKRDDTVNAVKFRNKSESLCEDALEILQEIVDADASLQIWFDRALDFGFGSHIDAQLGNLPRVVMSRGIEKQSGDIRIMTKQQVKISIVEQAIDALK